MATLKPTVINGGGTTAPLILKNGASGYREGLRIMPTSNWSDIVLGGSGLSEASNINSTSWFFGNNNGNFYITRGGSTEPYSSSGAQIKCVSNAWTIKGDTTFTGNISSFNMTGYITFENGAALGYGTIPVQYGEDCVSASGDAIWIASGDHDETAGIMCDGDTVKIFSPMDDDPVFVDTDGGDEYPILHTGNMNDYVLKLSGGSNTVSFNSNNLPQFSGAPTYLVGIEAFASGGTLKWQSADSISVGNATKASRLYYDSISNTNSFATGLQAYFNSNKSDIPRNVGISFYSSAYGNGSQLFGYWLQGYDNGPYGGFFVCHYNSPKYVGISNGTYTEHTIVTSENIGDYSVGSADALSGFTNSGSAGWGWMGQHTSTWHYITALNGVNSNGSELAFFHNNGQVSMQVDGTFFVNEGQYEVVYCQSYSSGTLTLNTVYGTH